LPLTSSNSLPAIPILNSPAEHGLSAVLTNKSDSFYLFRDGTTLGFYELPVYDDMSGSAKKAALTPLAIAADLTIIGGFLFLYTRGFGFFN
jgi:hypothetical protein